MNEKLLKRLMQKAIDVSIKNVERHGGPFGAVIAKDGKVIAVGKNRVTKNNDPTAHAEITAIRKAALKLKTFDLSGCEIFSSCEPCPMCLCAIYWAHIDKIYYGNTQSDAKNIGFDDSFIYDELKLKPADRKVAMQQLLPDKAIRAFEDWNRKEDKVTY